MLNRSLIFNRLNWRLWRRNAAPPPIKKNTSTYFNQVSPIPQSYREPYYPPDNKGKIMDPPLTSDSPYQENEDDLEESTAMASNPADSPRKKTNPMVKAIQKSKINHKQKVVEMQKENQRKLDELVEKATHELLCVKSAFPFNLFPDELIIDANKISIIYRQFLAAEQIRTIIIKDIEDVWVESIPFFATLKIKSVRAIELDVLIIRNLTKDDAVKAQRLIQGLMLSEQQEVELAEVNEKNLDKKMEELGKADSIVEEE